MKRQRGASRSSKRVKEDVEVEESAKKVKEDVQVKKSSKKGKEENAEVKKTSEKVKKEGAEVKERSPAELQLLAGLERDYLAVNTTTEPTVGLTRLREDFYDVPCEQLAKALLGKILVQRLWDGIVVRGRIVETESYPGGDDKGSVSYNGRITEKCKAVFMKPGVMFVYLTYGMYHCINISSQGPGAAVLLRAIEPLEGMEYMQRRREAMKKGSKKPEFKHHELCNGPAKLCICFDITKSQCNMRDLCVWDDMWVEADELSARVEPSHIVTSTRIGIDLAGAKWASLPLRFYLYGFQSVSRIDKEREQALQGVCKALV